MEITHKQPLFIIGLQKSGTTLLNRLLMEQSDYFFSPFKLEGREFWGDDPPFTPTAKPCGEIYQKHQGKHGHQVTEDDFDINHQKLLHQRMSKVSIDAPILINKNPYNTMRIPWLKKMFPDCKIVAMVRNPYANIFSLMKKHIPHDGRGLGPEDGWWGVKPINWESLKSNYLTYQLAKQWRDINNDIVSNKDYIDMTINYKYLCHNPSLYIQLILKQFGINKKVQVGPLNCMDDEFKQGSRLLSKNRIYKDNNNLDIHFDNPSKANLKPLTSIQKITIKFICHQTNKLLKRTTTYSK